MVTGKRGAINHQVLVLSLLIVGAIFLSYLHEGLTGQILVRPKLPRSCGNGVCQGFETACSCAADCSQSCRDGCVTGTEECDGTDDDLCPGSCLSDCTCSGGGSSCDFDGICEPGQGETVDNCPTDCDNYKTCEEAGQQSGGRVFYVNPSSGSDSGSGTINSPWKTLKNVVDSGKLGTTIVSNDVVCLYNGNHGSVFISNTLFTGDVIIMSQQGQDTVQLGQLGLTNVKHITFDGLIISPIYAQTFYSCQSIVDMHDNVKYVTIKNSDVF